MFEDIVNDNKFIDYVENIGIDTKKIKTKIHVQINKDNKNIFDTFSNRIHKITSPNINLENIIFKESNQYLYIYYKDSVVFEENIKIDIKTLIATQNSLIERPGIKKPSELEEGFKTELENENSFLRIAKFENELLLDDNGYRHTGQSIIFEGLIPLMAKINPFSEELSSSHIWRNTFYDYEPRNIIGFCKYFNSIESKYILWLNSYWLDFLELRLDDFNNGLRALNNDNEVILEFRFWRDQLIGNGASFVGLDSNIAKLEGCDLILREDYFKKLKEISPDMEFYSKKIEIEHKKR